MDSSVKSHQPVDSPPSPAHHAQPAAQKTDVLGILSIVFAFVGLQIVGFILGLIGVKKAKEEHRPATLSKVGWILNLIFMIIAIIAIGLVILLAALSTSQEAARDTAHQAERNLSNSRIDEREPNAGLIAGYEKVTEGMAKAAAEEELGASTRCSSSSYSSLGTYESCTYGGFDDGISIHVTYKNGAVQSKSKTEY